ncbi:beta-galactosidase domain 4-containing protein [Streptomyces sp. NPDC001621]|uniref:beta-galactosidase domain 4-containing protein n=1 Tax=Streptomyces sp. NPDC001621 TaxID=3364594 RepID=UPI0036CF94A1
MVTNQQRLQGLARLTATWELTLPDGRTLTAPAALPDLRPGETAAVPLPLRLPKDGGAIRLTLRVLTAEDRPGTPRGTQLCAPRLTLRPTARSPHLDGHGAACQSLRQLTAGNRTAGSPYIASAPPEGASPHRTPEGSPLRTGDQLADSRRRTSAPAEPGRQVTHASARTTGARTATTRTTTPRRTIPTRPSAPPPQRTDAYRPSPSPRPHQRTAHRPPRTTGARTATRRTTAPRRTPPVTTPPATERRWATHSGRCPRSTGRPSAEGRRRPYLREAQRPRPAQTVPPKKTRTSRIRPSRTVIASMLR